MATNLMLITDHAKRLSLPPFAERLRKWLGTVTIGARTKKYLSAGMPALTEDERRQLESKIADIELDLETSSKDVEIKAALLAEMFMLFPASQQSEMILETKTNVYLETLAGVPAWAVRIALRKWYAGKVKGVTEREFTFAPSTAYLLRASEDETRPYRELLDELRVLRDIKPLDETIRELESDPQRLRPVS